MKIAFLGDMAFVGEFDITKNTSVKEKLKVLSNYLKQFDIVVANLESPLTAKKKSFTCKGIHVRSDPKNIELLKFLNVNVVCLSNNHIFDFGIKGYKDTIELLKSNNIDYFGVNDRYLMKSINGNIINFFGYCCYTANGSRYKGSVRNNYITPLNYNEIESVIKEHSGINVLSMHWSDENICMPRSEHILFAHKLASKYSFILYGHHPHVLQGSELVNDSIISYSLGNFCFDEINSISVKGLKNKMHDDNKKGCILSVEIDKNEILNYEYMFYRWHKNECIILNDESIERYNRCLDIKDYDHKRDIELKKTILSIPQKKNISWVMKRLNYYYIGAVIKGILNKNKYEKSFIYFE